MRNANSIAIAGGAIATATINALVKKGVLTPDEAIQALGDAQRQIAIFLQTGGPDAFEAAKIIGECVATLNKNRV
jgi:hypothetical protein